jgi:hypothetical protein
MAIFVWALPVATVYPPSALTVSALRYTQMEMRNISILDPPQTDFDPWNIKLNKKSMLSVPFTKVRSDQNLPSGEARSTAYS